MKIFTNPRAILIGIAVRLAKEFIWDNLIIWLAELAAKTETPIDDDLVAWIDKQKADFDRLIDYALDRG